MTQETKQPHLTTASQMKNISDEIASQTTVDEIVYGLLEKAKSDTRNYPGTHQCSSYVHAHTEEVRERLRSLGYFVLATDTDEVKFRWDGQWEDK